MGSLRRVALTALPKFVLSRTTGLLARTPLPSWLRPRVYGWFARRYGASLDEMAGTAAEYRSLAQFFQRPLRAGARPLAGDALLVWPCDGKVITSGPLDRDRIPQVKGRDYSAAQLLQDGELAAALAGGSQVTVYLAPGDYHRVHAPFDAEVTAIRHIPGKLFPVNPGAVESIPELFPRNERVVFTCRLPDGVPAAVVMVSALNVGDTVVSVQPGPVARGEELGRFGFGSTTIVLVGPQGPTIPELSRETKVRVNQRIA